MPRWQRQRDWLDDEREFLIGKDRLEQDLHDWQKAPDHEKTEALLSGLKLTRARSYLAAKPLQLSEAERKFIQASIAHHEAEASRRHAGQVLTRISNLNSSNEPCSVRRDLYLRGFETWRRHLGRAHRLDHKQN